MTKRVPILCLLLVLYACLFQPVHAEEIGRVTAVSGDVRLNPQGENRPLRVGDAIAATDVVVTGTDGHVTIELQDGSRLQIDTDSELRLSEYRLAPRPRSLIDLTRGRLRAIVTDTFSRHKESFRIRSLTAVMGVQGTDFLVYAEASQTLVRVVEGWVRVVNVDPAIPQALILGPGEAARVRRGAPPEPLSIAAAGPATFGSGGRLDLRARGRQAEAAERLAPDLRGAAGGVPPRPHPPRP